MQAEELHVLHALSHFNHGIHVFHADAELVFSQAGSDVGMGMSTYIRVDTESYLGYLALGFRQFVDDFQLRNRFHVEAEDVMVKLMPGDIVTPEYGVPVVEFSVKGKVMDADFNPIENIEVMDKK